MPLPLEARSTQLPIPLLSRKNSPQGLFLDNVDDFLVRNRSVEFHLALGAELDGSFCLGVKGVILSNQNVLSGQDLCTALADDDGT